MNKERNMEICTNMWDKNVIYLPFLRYIPRLNPNDAVMHNSKRHASDIFGRFLLKLRKRSRCLAGLANLLREFLARVDAKLISHRVGRSAA